MGKVKSTIITVITVLAVLTLLLFSVISCDLPGGVERYNSILSNLHLGSEFTGDAYATILPEGVISAEEYRLSMPEDTTSTEYEDYVNSYVQSGSYYIERETLAGYTASGKADTDEEVEEALPLIKNDVENDAAILSERFGAMEYTSYSVSVVDEVAIKVSVPSNYTYAAYKGNDNDSYTTALSEASTSIYYLTLGGELTLRNTAIGGVAEDDYDSTRTLLNARANVADYFKSITVYSNGSVYAIKVTLTSDGEDWMNKLSAKVSGSDDAYIRFYVGKTSIINLTCDSTIDEDTFYIQVDDLATAKNYAALLNSVATGSPLSLEYSYSEVKSATSVAGSNTAMLTAIAVLVILIGIMAYSIFRYKKLGIVLSIMIVAFAVTLVVALFFLETQLTMIGLLTALMCLMLFVGSNYWSYEAVKKEISVGRTVQNAVKTGYKKTVSGILDLHLVLLVIGFLLAFIAVGEAAACGTIMIICTLASYCLHWYGRFMWYVTMSPVKGESAKRKFFGVKGKTFEEMEEEFENAAKNKKSREEV